MERDWVKEKPNNWEIAEWSEKINHMSHYEMGLGLRFSKLGATPLFIPCVTVNETPIFKWDHLHEKFMQRFISFGGWTPLISKMVGPFRTDVHSTV
jgi:hypothetical protein